jgi:hypothetical protein
MFSVLETLVKDHAVTVTSLVHAYRINGVIDLWKNQETAYDIIRNQYHTIKDDAEMLDWAIQRISVYQKREPFKKTAKGRVSYQEFKHNLHNSVVNLDATYGEDYHWKRQPEVKGDDLYFLIHEGMIKIGRSKNPKKRIKELETGLCHYYEMFVFKGKGFMETTLHQCFKDMRERGEWFRYGENNRISFFLKRYFKYPGCYKIRRIDKHNTV